ncbi:hypothetical protein KY285_026245 [Solanum tuberosum]|nr:hypothetical protein KY285_026245 [Solanum tuberosum]
MTLFDGGQIPPGAGLQLSKDNFPPLPSTSTDSIIPNLPLEKSYVDSMTVREEKNSHDHESLRRDISLVGGIPQVKWTEEKVERMNHIEYLQYAVIWKFTYKWFDLEELRKIIPSQCKVK